MAVLFLLGLLVGGAAVWWWSTGGPKSFGQASETVRQVATDVGQKPPSSSSPTLPTPVPVIVPAASPTPHGAGEESANQAVLPESTPTSAAARPATPPLATAEALAASPTVRPTVTPVAAPTAVPTSVPTLTPAGTPVHLLSPLEIMRLVDRGKLTEDEAVAILAQRKDAAKKDTRPKPTATPKAASPVVPTITLPEVTPEMRRPVVIEVAPPTPKIIPPPVSPPSGNRPSPAKGYLGEKKYMLTLINGERKKAGLAPVVLGNNAAAQQHAEALLRHNIGGHWGLDGLLPQMRYTLAGGVNYVSENVSAYRLQAGMPYRKQTPEALLKRSHQSLMTSPGHRKTILGKWRTKVSLGIDCNDYACSLVQNFAGDYVEFDQKPVITRGTLRLAGWLKGGFQLSNIQVWYHEPPHPLTVAQLDAAHAYTLGQELATIVIPPPPPNTSYPKKATEYSWTASTDPYEVNPEEPATASPPKLRTKTVPYTVADLWSRSASNFQIRANIAKVIDDLGPGVYMVVIWGKNEGEVVPLTNYAVFVD